MKTSRAAVLSMAALLCAWPPGGGAQLLNDPTRPPPQIYSDAPGEAGAPGGAVLQSVKISPTERLAIIGGESIKLGGRYGEARVVRITESEVVLRSANGTETLRMYPGVSIKPTAPEPAAVRTQAAGKTAASKREPAPRTQGQPQ